MRGRPCARSVGSLCPIRPGVSAAREGSRVGKVRACYGVVDRVEWKEDTRSLSCFPSPPITARPGVSSSYRVARDDDYGRI